MTTKLTSAFACLFFAVFILTATSCKKEMINTSKNQNLQAAALAAKAQSFTTSEKIPTDLTVFVPCANGGTGEIVELSGNLHVVTSFTINGNNVSGKTHFQPQGISGVGTITGDKYQATGVTQDQFKGSFKNGRYKGTYINNFRFIGRGPGNNGAVHEVYHYTINANGVITSTVDNIKVSCK